VPGVEPLNGVDALAGRVTFLFRPSDSLTANLKLSMSRSGGTPYGAHALNVDPAATGFNGTIGWFDKRRQVRRPQRHSRRQCDAQDRLAGERARDADLGHRLRLSAAGTKRATTADCRSRSVSTTRTPISRAPTTFPRSLRLASHDTGAFGWLAGLYFGRESTHATLQYHFFDGYNLGYFFLRGWNVAVRLR